MDLKAGPDTLFCVENRAADYLSRWHSNYKNTVNFKSCIEGGNYREVEVLEEFFMFSHDW
jgi:hypothetical protein